MSKLPEINADITAYIDQEDPNNPSIVILASPLHVYPKIDIEVGYAETTALWRRKGERESTPTQVGIAHITVETEGETVPLGTGVWTIQRLPVSGDPHDEIIVFENPEVPDFLPESFEN